jgi:hypothetical protein
MLEQVKAGKAGSVQEVSEQMLQACAPGEHVSQALSVLLLDKLPLCLKQSYYLRSALADVCCVLHPATLPGLLALPAQPAEGTTAHPLAEAVQGSLQAISARHAFLTLASLASLPEKDRP